MILEVAVLDIKKGMLAEFEQAFIKAQSIISAMEGYTSHQLQKCIEKENRYILLVNWESLEDHTREPLIKYMMLLRKQIIIKRALQGAKRS